MNGNWKGPIGTISFDANFEKLEGPGDSSGNRQHYLICAHCDKVLLMAWNVVGVTCDDCYTQETPEELLHVTRVEGDPESGYCIYGHTTDHCDPAGCAGDEYFWPDIHGDEIEVGDIINAAGDRI